MSENNRMPIIKKITEALSQDIAVFNTASETIDIKRSVANSFQSLSFKSENFIEPFFI